MKEFHTRMIDLGVAQQVLIMRYGLLIGITKESRELGRRKQSSIFVGDEMPVDDIIVAQKLVSAGPRLCPALLAALDGLRGVEPDPVAIVEQSPRCERGL